jgi:hypothetical protein
MTASDDILASIPSYATHTATVAAAEAAAATEEAALARAHTTLSAVLNLTSTTTRMSIIQGLRSPIRTYVLRPSSVTITEVVPASLTTLLQGKGYTVVSAGDGITVSGW